MKVIDMKVIGMKVIDVVHQDPQEGCADWVFIGIPGHNLIKYERFSATDWRAYPYAISMESLEEAYQVYLKEKGGSSMKVTNVVHEEEDIISDWVYVEIDDAHVLYRRYHAGDWNAYGSSVTARTRERLEEAYQVYLKERILLKEEIMKKNSMPTTPGLYWGKSPMMKSRRFDYIVCVKGKSPMLYVDWIFDRITGRYYNVEECCVDDIGVWGPKIDDPDEEEE